MFLIKHCNIFQIVGKWREQPHPAFYWEAGKSVLNELLHNVFFSWKVKWWLIRKQGGYKFMMGCPQKTGKGWHSFRGRRTRLLKTSQKDCWISVASVQLNHLQWSVEASSEKRKLLVGLRILWHKIPQCSQIWVEFFWLIREKGILLHPIMFFPVTHRNHVDFLLYSNATFLPSMYWQHSYETSQK